MGWTWSLAFFQPIAILELSNLEAMRLAGDYAYAGRDWVCGRVAQILGAPIVEEVHNHHNYAWREEHNGEQLWVVRKGATPAFPGQRGFVGGTMGEQSVISKESKRACRLFALFHCARRSRAMGRREAAGIVDRKTGEVKRAGKVTQEMMRVWVERAGIELRGAGLDESPDCYKRLDEVLEAVGDTVRILHRLTPVESPWRERTSSIHTRIEQLTELAAGRKCSKPPVH